MKHRRGFTLLEVLLAISVLSIMGLMVFGSFRNLVDATVAVEEAFGERQLSEQLLTRIEESLRSAVYFDSDPRRYTFLYEKGTGSPPDDKLSWVTRSTALLPPELADRGGLNRIELSIQEVDGEQGLAIRATSSLLDPESDEAENAEPWLISRHVKGLETFFYDLTEQDWVDEWERDNQLPVFIALHVHLRGEERGAEMQVHTLGIEIPVGKVSRETRRGRRRSNESGGQPEEER